MRAAVWREPDILSGPARNYRQATGVVRHRRCYVSEFCLPRANSMPRHPGCSGRIFFLRAQAGACLENVDRRKEETMSLREARLGYREHVVSVPHLYAAARKFALQRASRVPGLGPRLVEVALKRRYGSHVITPLKVRNFIQAHHDEESKAVVVDSAPYHLNLDLYNVCNLRCRFCPTGTDQLDRERKRFTAAKAKQVIDAVKDYVIVFSPFQWGEPLLIPETYEVIRYAHDAGMYTSMHSNFSVKVKDLGRKLVESRLDTLLVSVDGLEQGVHETYRRNVNNDFIFANVRELVAARKKLGSKTPRIELALLVFRHNEHDVPLLEQKRKELGVDAFVTRKAVIYEESWIPEGKAFQPLTELFTGTCSFLYQDLNIEADGGVSPCCINTSRRWDVGRVEDLTDLKAFWNNPKHQAMRAYFAGFHREGQAAEASPSDQPLLCHSCDWVSDCRAHADLGKLSPLPPSFAAESMTLNHGIAPKLLPVLQGNDSAGCAC